MNDPKPMSDRDCLHLYGVSKEERYRLHLANSGKLSFRDQCAIAAMAQYIPGFLNDSSTLELNVKCAFDWADAMEAERKKRGDK